MNGIRPLEDRDIPAVADLHRRVFGSADTSSTDRERRRSGDLEEFLAAIFCGHPWQDEEMHSLVYEKDGRIAGCLGRMPRPMKLDGRRICAVVCHNFMVAPEARSTLAGVRLARAAVDLARDVLLAEGNDISRIIWERVGGTTSHAHSLRWRRLLRPASYLLGAGGNGTPPGALRRATRPLLRGVDRVVSDRGPSLFRLEESPDTSRDLAPEELLRCTERAAEGRALRPDYDGESVQWLLDRLGRRNGPVSFRARHVADPQGEPVGWYLYYVRPDGISEVVQMGAVGGDFERVLRHLLRDAWEQGAVGITGQADPLQMAELTDAGCLLDADHTWLLVHARQPGILEAIRGGDAFLTRLECEGWMRLAHA